MRQLRRLSTEQGQTDKVPAVSGQEKSFKGQLYESTSARLARERVERERFSRERSGGTGRSGTGRNSAITFGMLFVNLLA